MFSTILGVQEAFEEVWTFPRVPVQVSFHIPFGKEGNTLAEGTQKCKDTFRSVKNIDLSYLFVRDAFPYHRDVFLLEIAKTITLTHGAGDMGVLTV